MASLNEQLDLVAAGLQGQGLHPANIDLFSGESVPLQELHNGYVIESITGQEIVQETGCSTYNMLLTIRVASHWSTSGAGNYHAALKNMVTLFEAVESAVTGNGIIVNRSPDYGTLRNIEYLSVTIELSLYATRVR